MKKLTAIVDKLWFGDVSYDEATEDLTDKDIQELEAHLEEYWEVYQKGVSIPNGIDATIRGLNGHKLLQTMIDKFE